MVDLAVLEGSRSHFKEAEQIYIKALDETEDVLGVTDPRFKVCVAS